MVGCCFNAEPTRERRFVWRRYRLVMGRTGSNKAAAASCPCGSGVAYSRCCRPLHLGADAVTAEALMRSRYSAFAKGLPDYLLHSWHPDTRPECMDLDRSMHWTGLRVIETVEGGVQDDVGTVTFEADHLSPSGAATLREVSRFERVAGRWVYVSGTV